MQKYTYKVFKAGRDFKQSSSPIWEYIFMNMKHMHVLSAGSGRPGYFSFGMHSLGFELSWTTHKSKATQGKIRDLGKQSCQACLVRAAGHPSTCCPAPDGRGWGPLGPAAFRMGTHTDHCHLGICPLTIFGGESLAGSCVVYQLKFRLISHKPES